MSESLTLLSLFAPRLLYNPLRVWAYRRTGMSVGEDCYLARHIVLIEPARIVLRDNIHIAGRCVLDGRGGLEIGSRVVINEGVRLLTLGHEPNSPMFETTAGPITIGRYAWLATGAMVLPGVTIGDGAVIGAGAVVARDVPPRAIVVGNPARSVGERAEIAYSYIPAAEDLRGL